jgi:preprotein translocase subunit SecG
MSRATASFVLVFFTTSLTLAYMSSHKEGSGSVVKAMAEKSAVVNTTAVPSAKTDAVTPAAPATTQDIPK